MRLYLAGVNHFNPLCRGRLRDWFAEVSRAEQASPAFIAVEWNQRDWLLLRAQRRRYREIARRVWPGVTAEDLDILSRSLAYEGDTHRAIFPKARTLWLDSGRPFRRSILTQAEARIALYQRWQEWGRIAGNPAELPKEMETATSYLTYEDLNTEVPEIIRPERDVKWVENIRAMTKPESSWAIAVVGASHTMNKPQHFHRLLVEAGFSCEVVMIQPLARPPEHGWASHEYVRTHFAR